MEQTEASHRICVAASHLSLREDPVVHLVLKSFHHHTGITKEHIIHNIINAFVWAIIIVDGSGSIGRRLEIFCKITEAY